MTCDCDALARIIDAAATLLLLHDADPAQLARGLHRASRVNTGFVADAVEIVWLELDPAARRARSPFADLGR